MLAHRRRRLVGTEETDYQYGNVTNDTLFGLGGDDILPAAQAMIRSTGNGRRSRDGWNRK